jgi:hypothetical protein
MKTKKHPKRKQPNETSDVVVLGFWREPDEPGKPWVKVSDPKQKKK